MAQQWASMELCQQELCCGIVVCQELVADNSQEMGWLLLQICVT